MSKRTQAARIHEHTLSFSTRWRNRGFWGDISKFQLKCTFFGESDFDRFPTGPNQTYRSFQVVIQLGFVYRLAQIKIISVEI